MLRIIQNSSAGGVKSYYSTADYYSEGQEMQGMWGGIGAKRLGLSGVVEQSAWNDLCDNRQPGASDTLTLRRKAERRVGYDFNFHVPKSVSLLYSLSNDERILTAFRESVDDTMRDMESEMKTRVRINGSNEDRTTGNMLWGQFVHVTARPVNGVPDPHLHAHCFVFNTTFDKQERRWKAGQFAALKRDAPYFEAVFHARLADKLGHLGLRSHRTKTGWEIEGISPSALAKFSRRTALIEDEAKEKGITDAEEKSELGAKTRERKQKAMSIDELRALWRAQLTPDERADIERVREKISGEALGDGEEASAAREAVDLAIEHCFERESVVPERKVLAAALKGAVGKASVAAVEQEWKRRDLLTAERNGRRVVTTRAVLAEEDHMIGFARAGRGSRPALAEGTQECNRPWLNADQRKAVRHVLESRDRVILIRGAAGVGKTSMMKEAVEAIEAGGTKVFTFAPSAEASRGVLKEEGFASADTVARLLVDRNLQKEIKGQVLWLDEAGLLGTRTMAQVFDLAERQDARVILSGDRRQHGAVERGAALRLLETEAGLIPAEIKEIMRQKGEYKRAVEDLSEERTEEGFKRLDGMGWIKEVDHENRYKTMAADYIENISQGKTALVVSPTHAEGKRIGDEIRHSLRRLGKLGEKQQAFTVLTNANLTVAERRDAMNYMAGDVVEFHQNAKGYGKGERLVVGDALPPLAQAERFQLFHTATLSLSPGDLIRITHGGKTVDKEQHDLRNGAIYTVKGFKPNGDIQLTNGWNISKDFGHFTHGYVTTSHTSQGKTVDRVIIGQSSASFPASSREQFYVSVSRGRENATIYTDDRAALLQAVNQSDERLSATEMVSQRNVRRRHLVMSRLEHPPEHALQPTREQHSRVGHE
jgi:conjugative relaxase-like TrwC/TraI family protein